MSFDFDEVYVMRLAHGDSYPQIVLGVKEVDVAGESAIKFWRTSGQYPFRTMRGRVVGTTGNTVEFVVNHQYTFDFEPLTLALWHELGRDGRLLGYKTLKSRFQDDDSLHKFYVDEFLPDGYSQDT